LLEMAHTALTAALAAALCLVRQADGHGLLTNPAPRTGTNRAGPNKGNVGPCGTGGGNTNAGASSMTVAAGETAALEWRIDANHGGPCQINLAATGAAINEPANNALTPLCQNGACPAGAQVGVENTNNNNNDPANGIFACAQNGGNDDRTVTVPADAAPGPAVLQWQWNGDAMYYDCMDITIQAAEGTGGGTNGGTDGEGGGTTGGTTGGNGPMIAGAIVGVLLAYFLYTHFCGGSKAPPAPDGYDQGYGQGGYDQGGYDQGGYDQGGYDQGGYDQGGYDQGYGAPPPMAPRPGPPPMAPRPGAGGYRPQPMAPRPLPPRRY